MKSVIPSPHAQNLISTSEGQLKCFPRDVFVWAQCLVVNLFPLLFCMCNIAQQKQSCPCVETYAKEM